MKYYCPTCKCDMCFDGSTDESLPNDIILLKNTEQLHKQEQEIKSLETKISLWKTSYHESERCLIERGKEINSLKDKLQQIQYDKEAHVECARNAAYFVEKACRLQAVMGEIRDLGLNVPIQITYEEFTNLIKDILGEAKK